MEKFGFPEDQPIEHVMVNHSLEIAQKRVETHNFEIRKQLLEYDNVMNKQREVIYQQRRQILEESDIRDTIFEMVDQVIENNVGIYCAEEKNTLGLSHWIKAKFDLELKNTEIANLSLEQTIEFVKKYVMDEYLKRQEKIGQEKMFGMERAVALWVVDSRWKEHLLIMDSLKEGIHLRGYGQKEPLVEYQKESYSAFQEMIEAIKEDIVDTVFKTKIAIPEEAIGVFEQSPKNYVHSEYSSLHKEDEKAETKSVTPQVQAAVKKAGRNDPCPCGSGKKYKKCCGK
jgi:preprotein translocase subunit SecA